MSDDVYRRLREFVDRMPGGLPESGTGIEIEMLKKYFTPDEAELFMNLNPFPEPASAIAARAQKPEDETGRMLESMASQGSIFRMRFEDQVFYMAMSFLIGIYEFHVKAMDRKFAELMEEYFPHLTGFWSTLKNKQMRVVPIGEAVDSLPEVGTYDRVREMVAGSEDIAVAPCICRVEKSLLDRECSRPLETCLTFGTPARYYIENGIGRRITLEECLKILDEAEKEALVVCPTNAQEISNVCLCCSCCCGLLEGLRHLPRPADHALSSFRATIDPELCADCGTCLERCQIDALVEKDEFVEVDPARCIGCGLCVPTCPEGAASLTPKPEAESPPANYLEMNQRILQERGLA